MFLFHSINGQKCVITSCNTLNNNTCFRRTANNIMFDACPTNYYCPYDSSLIYPLIENTINTLNCIPIRQNYSSDLPKGSLVEYEYCRENSECGSNSCINNRCSGLLSYNNCNTTNECLSNYFCRYYPNSNKSICSIRKTPGAHCETDVDCGNLYNCINQTCYPLLYNEAGSKAFGGDAKFCKSEYMNENGVCEDLLNVGTSPFTCDNNLGQCIYRTSITNKLVTINNTCMCDLDGSNAYCMLGTDSNEHKNHIEARKRILKYQCHFYNKGKCSLIPYEEYINLYRTYYAVRNIKSYNPRKYYCLNPPVIDLSTNCPFCSSSSLEIRILLLIFLVVLNIY